MRYVAAIRRFIRQLDRHCATRALSSFRAMRRRTSRGTRIGNVIRRDNVEAQAVQDRALTATSMSAALRAYVLPQRRAVVVAGTHGKTTTSTIVAHLLRKGDLDPGWFIGGIPKNLPSGSALGKRSRSLLTSGATQPRGPSPFVLEGDEYDAVYWHKQPKFFDYIGVSDSDIVILTSVEQDHIDIYPTMEAYAAVFAELVARIPPNGLLICDAHDVNCRRASAHAKCRVVYTALDGDDVGDATPTWMGAPSTIDELGNQRFDLYAGGISVGRFSMRIPGAHNVRNAVMALAACAEGFGVPFANMRGALVEFEGVRRRQDLLGEPGGVRVYDDFAHHPTAVVETLRALRNKHPAGKLFAVFEPRSATACRALHQAAYATAFGAADRVLFAPLGRSNVPDDDKLDLQALSRTLGPKAHAAASIDELIASLVQEAHPGDTIALLSNGAFGGIYTDLLAALSTTTAGPR
jgi:UDP-N-acetylmuramate: L-alanyl-gamma-D-glutamyl-meso-diaminopimelate ligase